MPLLFVKVPLDDTGEVPVETMGEEGDLEKMGVRKVMIGGGVTAVTRGEFVGAPPEL